MKTNKKDVVNDLKLLIDISCLKGGDIKTSELFHKMLVGISYKAVDVSIDYDRKRIYMNVITDQNYYDLEMLNPYLASEMSVNLTYKDLNLFLKSCIIEDLDSLNYYYSNLISRFFRRKELAKDLEPLETA